MPKTPLTISDWVITLKKKGLENLANGLHSDKKEDDKRLVKLGIPVFDRLEQIPYKEFTEENEKVMAFLKKYEQFIVRAIPREGMSDLPRRPKIGVYSLEECKEFLEGLFSQDPKLIGQEDNYNVSLVENEPTTGSGIIISKNKDVLVEISEVGLDKLSHGKVDQTFIGEFDFHNSSRKIIKYNTEDKQKRTLMWNALQWIRVNSSPNIDFKKGYFEFLITEKNRIVFWDYKINPAYLS